MDSVRGISRAIAFRKSEKRSHGKMTLMKDKRSLSGISRAIAFHKSEKRTACSSASLSLSGKMALMKDKRSFSRTSRAIAKRSAGIALEGV
ncbi:MAG: hypothetical protein WCO29_10895 [Nostocales cyanobacterium ELA583]